MQEYAPNDDGFYDLFWHVGHAVGELYQGRAEGHNDRTGSTLGYGYTASQNHHEECYKQLMQALDGGAFQEEDIREADYYPQDPEDDDTPYIRAWAVLQWAAQNGLPIPKKWRNYFSPAIANFPYWLHQAESWTVEEAAMLLAGYEPSQTMESHHPNTSQIAHAIRSTLGIALQEPSLGRVFPAEVVQWHAGKKHEVPPALRCLLCDTNESLAPSSMAELASKGGKAKKGEHKVNPEFVLKTLDQRVRENTNPNRSQTQIRKETAKELGISYSTLMNHNRARRQKNKSV